MKRKVLAMLVPALLVAGAANAAEIYNKNGNKVELYGKMVGERILTDRESGEKGDNSQDTSYARVGVKGETQINPEPVSYTHLDVYKRQTIPLEYPVTIIRGPPSLTVTSSLTIKLILASFFRVKLVHLS